MPSLPTIKTFYPKIVGRATLTDMIMLAVVVTTRYMFCYVSSLVVLTISERDALLQDALLDSTTPPLMSDTGYAPG